MRSLRKWLCWSYGGHLYLAFVIGEDCLCIDIYLARGCTYDMKILGVGGIPFYLSILDFSMIWSLDGALMEQYLNFHLQVIPQFTAEVVFVVFVF